MAGRPVGWTREQDDFLRTFIRRSPMPSGNMIARLLKERFSVSRAHGMIWNRIRFLQNHMGSDSGIVNPVPEGYKELVDRIEEWHATGKSALPIRVSEEAKERMSIRHES